MLFEDTSDPLGGSALAANPALEDTTAPQAEPTMALPDLSPVIAAMPRAPMQPLTPPPHPTQDPRQQLMALFTAAFAAANGPHSPASVGALHGLSQANDALQAQQMRDWQFKVGQQVAQNKILEQQQAELDRQRTLTLQKNLQAFSTAATSAGSKEEYDRLADAYGNGLASMGYRITPNWLRSNMPYVAPTQQTVAEKAYKAWLSNTSNARLLEQNPQAAMDSVIRVDLNGDGVAENVPLARVAEAAGHGFATDSQGNVLSVPKPQAGTGAFDVKFNALVDQFRAENRREPTAQEKSGLVDKAIEASKEKPPMNPLDEQEKKLRIQKLQQDLAQGAAPTSSALFELSPDKPTAENGNTIDPRTGLTPNALYQAAMTYALEGKMPSLGLGSRAQIVAARNAIQNKAGAIAQAAGVTLPQVRAEYAGNRTAITRLLPQNKAIEAAANTASDNLDLALGQSADVSRTGSKLANRYLQWARGELTPAAGLTKFETYIYTAAREYAKVTSGGALSAQGLTDSAAKEASKLLNSAQSPEAFSAAVEAMKADMANVVNERNKSLAGVSGTVASFLGGAPIVAPPPAAPSAALPTPGNTKKVGRFEVTVKQ